MRIVDDQDVTEPVRLDEVKAYCRIDADYTSDDATLNMLMVSARQRLESYLNVGFASREVTVYWDGCELKLPLVPNGDVVEVKQGAEVVASDKYTVSTTPFKTIYINSRAFGGGFNYFYSLDGSVEITANGNNQVLLDGYSVKYNTGYEDGKLPMVLKQALLSEIDYLFKLAGLPATDSISPNAAMLGNSYNNNYVLQ